MISDVLISDYMMFSQSIDWLRRGRAPAVCRPALEGSALMAMSAQSRRSVTLPARIADFN